MAQAKHGLVFHLMQIYNDTVQPLRVSICLSVGPSASRVVASNHVNGTFTISVGVTMPENAVTFGLDRLGVGGGLRIVA